MSQLNNNKLNMPRIVVMGPSKENLQDIAQHEEDTKNNQQKQEARRTSLVISHRKNSVSLPNLDDLKDLKEVKQQVKNSISYICINLDIFIRVIYIILAGHHG